MGLFGTNLFQINDCVSVPTFFHFVDHLWLPLQTSPFKNLWRINCLGWNFLQCGRIPFTLTKIMNKLISTKNGVFNSFVGPSEIAKPQLIYNWLKIGTFQPKFEKIYFFYQHSQPLYDVMQKEIENLEFVRGVNFEFIDSLKNNGTKHLLIFDDSCEEICNSRAFVDIATAGRHRGLSTICIKHNLFHQSKLGRDVELQNTHIVLFKSPRDVMQVTTLSTQLGLGSKPVDWYRDTTSVPFGHLLIGLSPCTDHRLRYCTSTRSFPQNFIARTVWNNRKLWTMNTKNLSTLQVFQSFSHKCKNLFLQSCPKEFVLFLCKCIINLLKGNLQSIKRHHVEKFQSEVRLLSLKRTTWKQRRDILASGRGLQLIKVITPPVLNHLSWFGAVFPRSCLCVQQKFDWPASYKERTSKVSTWTNSLVLSWFI